MAETVDRAKLLLDQNPATRNSWAAVWGGSSQAAVGRERERERVFTGKKGIRFTLPRWRKA